MRAISIARREKDVPLEAQTLTHGAVVSAQHLHWQKSVNHGLRAIKLATGDDPPPYGKGFSLVDRGKFAEYG